MIPCTVSGSARPSLVSPLGQHARELLCVQRIAAGAGEQRLLLFRRKHVPLEQLADQPGGLTRSVRPPAAG